MKPLPHAHLRRIAEHWPTIEKTLPAHANRAVVRQELDEIAAEALSSKKLVGQFETRARLTNQLISALGEDNPALVKASSSNVMPTDKRQECTTLTTAIRACRS
jgi:hypothetical protein